MAQVIYNVLGTLEYIPAEFQPFVVAVSLIVIATMLTLAFDAVLRLFGLLFSRLG